MDYRTLFSWHPSYTCLTHQVRHHVDQTYTDDSQEWVALSVYEKKILWGVVSRDETSSIRDCSVWLVLWGS